MVRRISSRKIDSTRVGTRETETERQRERERERERESREKLRADAE